MPETHLLVTSVPRLVREIIAEAVASAGCPDELRETDESHLLEEVERFRVTHVLAMQGMHELPDLYLRLLYRFPNLSLTTISVSGRTAHRYRLRHTVIADASLREVVQEVACCGDPLLRAPHG